MDPSSGWLSEPTAAGLPGRASRKARNAQRDEKGRAASLRLFIFVFGCFWQRCYFWSCLTFFGVILGIVLYCCDVCIVS